METSTPLLDLAAAVADLTPIDWPALEAEAADPVSRAALKRLRLLDRIVRACAAIVPPGSGGLSESGTTDADTPPSTWGPLTIHERIGRGTFGDVYRAHDRRLDRRVALKLLRPGREGDESSGVEVIREGQLLAKVRHPNVVTVYGAERIDGRVGMWMEFVDGRTLEDELRASGPLAPDKVTEVGLALCSALSAVHEAGLLHRDLKAQNVMRATDGRLLLTDFGAGRARTEGTGDESGTELAGTPLYLAPEVLNGAPASVASEIYGVGVLLYHLATGSFPVRVRTLRELRRAHERGERAHMRTRRDTVPKRLAAAIDRALDPDPAKRFTSPQDLRDALLRGRGWAARAAWVAGPVLAAVLVVGGLNVMWSLEPPLRVVSREVLPLDPYRVQILFAKGDGLYFRENDGVFSIVPGQAGRTTVIDPGLPFNVFAVSPVRQDYLAFARDTHRLWIYPVSGQPNPVGSVQCEAGAAWSPDGRRIACGNPRAISIVSPDGTTLQVLPVPNETLLDSLAWSPRGDVLRFTAVTKMRDLVRYTLWEVRDDGTSLRQVLPDWNQAFPPGQVRGKWGTGGGLYVFQATSDDRRIDLWAIRERHGVLDWTRSEPVRLTAGPESFESPFAVSPDGTAIYTFGIRRQGQLLKYDQKDQAFVPYLGGISATSVTFSRDGRSVAYTTYPDKKLFRADADGRNARQLVHTPVEIRGAAWSPDNKWIAFGARLETAEFKIYLLPVDGSTAPKAIRSGRGDRDHGEASWSPDGKQLCYGDVPARFGEPDGDEVLHIHDLETGQTSTVPGSNGLWSCRWSRDGRYIAGLRIGLDSRMMMINLFDLEKRTWRALTDAHHVNDFSWSRSSDYIYYDTASGPRSLRRVRVDTGEVEFIASLDNYALELWTALTPDDEPLVLHDTGTRAFYALKLGTR